MAMTAAERQAKYRKRALKDPDGLLLSRVNTMIDSVAYAKLGYLQSATGLNQKQCIEEAINRMVDSFKHYSKQKTESLQDTLPNLSQDASNQPIKKRKIGRPRLNPEQAMTQAEYTSRREQRLKVITERAQAGTILHAEVAELSHRDLCLIVAKMLHHPGKLKSRLNDSPLIKELKQRISRLLTYVRATVSTKPQPLPDTLPNLSQDASNQPIKNRKVGRPRLNPERLMTPTEARIRREQKMKVITERVQAGTILRAEVAGLGHRDLCLIVAAMLNHPDKLNSHLDSSPLIKELKQRINRLYFCA